MKRHITAAIITAAFLGSCASAPAQTAAEVIASEAPVVTEVVTEAISEAAETSAEETTAPPETTAQEEQYTPIKYEIDPEKPMLALTFDDGPNTTTTMQVLDLLEKYQVPASFFLIGANINDESEKAVRRAYALGCEIENHSRTHSYMNEMSGEDIAAEVKYVSDKVEEITGEPTRFFRPPYIAVSKEMYDNIDMPFICGAGCNDWNEKMTAERRAKSVIKQAADGTIFLLHDAAGNDQTVEALDTIIPTLLDEGYQFVTVAELFEAKGVPITAHENELFTVLGGK